ATDQTPVGDVGLPALVRHGRFEPDEGAAGPLVRLRGDEAPTRQDPPDRRDRGQLLVRMSALEVGPDRLGAGVDPEIRELLAEGDDLVLEDLSDPLRAPMRATRSGQQRRFAFGIEASAELVDPPRGHPVVAGHLGLRPSFDPDRRDYEHREHQPDPFRLRSARCRETGRNYVVNSDTAGGTL